MKSYKKVDVSESQLEDFIRQDAGVIEEGLAYVDHQSITDAKGRLDVLLVDSGKSLVLAELKVVQDDGMLMQVIDYYDFVCKNIEAYARLYPAHEINPKQQVRLLLVAPVFSQTLINRCKWINAPISLFEFVCLKFEGDNDRALVFSEQPIPAPPKVLAITQIEDHLNYITDQDVRKKASSLLAEIKTWNPGISIDPVQSGVSIKINGKVFAAFSALRKFYRLATENTEKTWTDYKISSDNDLLDVLPLMKATLERYSSSSS